jgi:hypothetical protein
MSKLPAATLHVEGPPETQETMSHGPLWPGPAGPSVEHVHIRQMCNARPVRIHGWFSSNEERHLGALHAGESQTKKAWRRR